MDKDLFARRALDDVAKLLTLQDRNPHSSTYGCFDRNYWHFRTIDFPSGMAQEFVWPLALAAATDVPGNAYYDSAAVRDWVEAGIRFAARAARSDGWCDDYYPYERATGAAAFSLLACLESYRLLGLEDGDLAGTERSRDGSSGCSLGRAPRAGSGNMKAAIRVTSPSPSRCSPPSTPCRPNSTSTPA